MLLTSGTRLGPYEIQAPLGAGGMGEVYRARDTRLDRTVAVKILPSQVAADRDLLHRFEREAQAVSSLNHPNICILHDVGQQDDIHFLVMELLEGETLAQRLARGPLPVAETIQAALGILSALEALHRHGLIHRDLKPANLFLTPHGLKLLDFGLARPIQEEVGEAVTKMTMSGALVGTPRYMSPESLMGQTVDARADLFAVGVIIYEMLAGKPPFAGDSIGQVVHAITHETPSMLSGSRAIVAVDRVIHRALAKSPEDRYQTAEATAQDLRQALRVASDPGELPTAQPITRLIVLPFRVLRPDPDTDFLSFSLSDAITASLSGLDSLVVRSSLAASRFSSEAPDLKAIAEQTDVDIVLVGTLLRAGPQLRVSCQLLEAPAGTVLWSHSAQVATGDIFQLQDDLAHRIVDSLSLPLTTREHALLKRDMPANAKAYEYYLRANPLSYERAQWPVARDLYLRCVEEDPRYAPAWARLGRMYYVIGKYFEEELEENQQRSQAAFERALEISPDLSIAHNLYASLEVDLGRAKEAMLRLVERAKGRGADPELFAGLVHACRYCGLLDASVAAPEQARRLDPKIRTSVAHAHYHLGDYQRVLLSKAADAPYIKGITLIRLGRAADAASELATLIERAADQHSMFVEIAAAVRDLAVGKRDESVAVMSRIVDSGFRDPEGLYYWSSHFAYLGELERAISVFGRAVEGGFFCYPAMARDSWLDPLRAKPEFNRLLHLAETRHREAVAAFLEAGGDRVLGLGGN